MFISGTTEPISTTQPAPELNSELLYSNIIVNYSQNGSCFKYVVIFAHRTLFPVLSYDNIWHSHIGCKSRQL